MNDLRADCSACAALCCLGLHIEKGPYFPIDKPAGLPCPNLDRHRCGIHRYLHVKRFHGCLQYDCEGAGQIVSRDVFDGRSWRDDPGLAQPMMDAFMILRQVQDIRGQLAASSRAFELTPELEAARARLEARLTPVWTEETLAAFDLDAARNDFNAFVVRLRKVGKLRKPRR